MLPEPVVARLTRTAQRSQLLVTTALAWVRRSLPVRCLIRFQGIQGRDRVLALTGQSFCTLVPLTIVVAAVQGADGVAVADKVIARFHVDGDTADSVRRLFERPPSTTGGISIFGALLLLVSTLSLIKVIQRTYEAAWELPHDGLRSARGGVTATALFVAQLVLAPILTGLVGHLPAGDAVATAARVAIWVWVWVVLQDHLLSRRVPRRSLLPGAVVVSAGLGAAATYATLWMPQLITRNTARYGLIGITLAILTWLLVVSAGVVLGAAISAEIGLHGVVARPEGATDLVLSLPDAPAAPAPPVPAAGSPPTRA